MVGEDVRAGDRLPEMAGAEQRDVVLAGGPQDLADLLDQRLDVVAHPALAELAEAGQVAADLGRVDVGVVRELLRGDRALAHLPGLGQHLEVAGEPRRDPERESIAVGEVRGPLPLGGLGRHVLDHADKVASLARSPSASRNSSETISPSSSTTGMRSRNRACSSSSRLDVDLLQLEAEAVRAAARSSPDARLVAEVAVRPPVQPDPSRRHRSPGSRDTGSAR